MDIRLNTVLIIGKDGKYLVGEKILTGELNWSDSPWDAWRTREKEKAKEKAEMTGGEIYLFNPVVGQLRKCKDDKAAC